MKLLISLLALTITSFSFAQQTSHTMDIGGVTRDYIQYLPVGFDSNTESLPVVFVLHGLGDVNSNMTNAGFKEIGDTARFISVYPQGLTNQFGSSSWDNGTLLAPVADDITFFNNMIDDMILNYNADINRIYFTGFSMGSIMSHHLACAINDRIAAIGTMSGTMSTDDIANCVPTYKTPVMHIHGTNDPTVPYDGAALPSLSLVDETMDFWINVHGCATTADSTQLPDTAADGLTVDRFVYQNCDPSSSVELWRVNGGDHSFFYEPVNDFTESIEIWLFFRQWSHSNPAAVSLNNISNTEFSISPNPSTGIFKINAEYSNMFEVYSTSGKLVHSETLNSGETNLDLTHLEKGIYIVKCGLNSESTQRISIQ
ncbi:MAG: T9SS type A sorting domain-containing protein [Crocinitomicaceae bacterium]